MKNTQKYYTLWLDFGDVQEQIDKLQKVEPVNDNAILWNFQVDYLKNKDKEAEKEIWLRFRLLCLKQIKKLSKQYSRVYSEYELDDKASAAALYVLRRYKKAEQNGTVYIIKNFVTCAYYGAKYSVFNNRENDYFLDGSISLEDIKQ